MSLQEGQQSLEIDAVVVAVVVDLSSPFLD